MDGKTDRDAGRNEVASEGQGCVVTTLDLRARRLEDLARRVAEGSYHVDPKELARALLEKEPGLFGGGSR